MRASNENTAIRGKPRQGRRAAARGSEEKDKPECDGRRLSQPPSQRVRLGKEFGGNQ